MLLESGAKASAGKDKLDEQALHYQAKQNDDLDLKEIFPNETEVGVTQSAPAPFVGQCSSFASLAQ